MVRVPAPAYRIRVTSSIDHPPAIDLRGVGMRRGQRWILRDINWTVPDGACAAILGPNGSGKSTLARILACHVWPSAGEVSILGSQFGNADLPETRRGIRLLQPAGPYDIDVELTAREVVCTGFFGTLALYDLVTPAMEQEALRVLTQVGMARLHDHAYATLSSGERVRALLARALVQRPRLLLLDEPTAGLDLLAREQMLAALQDLFDAEAHPPAVVLITHHVEELPPATSRVLLLCDGQAAAAGAPADVLTEANLSRVYRCPVQVRRTGGRFYLEVHPNGWKELMHRQQSPG